MGEECTREGSTSHCAFRTLIDPMHLFGSLAALVAVSLVASLPSPATLGVNDRVVDGPAGVHDASTTKMSAPPAGFGKWSPAKPGDSVSPCPFLNTMANYGIIPRTGITQDKLKSALEIGKVDWAFQKLLTGSTTMNLGTVQDGVQVVSLANLSHHNVIEHDVSLSRRDAYTGDQTTLVPAFIEQFVALSKDGKYLTEADLVHFRELREADSRATNPQISYGQYAKLFAWTETSFVDIMFRDETGRMRVDWIKEFFLKEKFPFELGWNFRPVSFAEVAWISARLRSGFARHATLPDGTD
ncbi:hypothetical protein H310_10788 [Aphanomyces invadans]|uniref:Heme haloperoxidase family profile domain-containing protein n=1 Tax=Aphanomyces invadans TaxID=157072 RepID=A0A024TR98_9STRA|nr:hypothetical protein H310_10788 [Aphanomyces invadans]ETV96156.1 hypothetical protein H310_10788 [Aphanomyces invadans]|eukprot:XP_008875467.1 hypothetical protein H310_10788 [Aphanomyces invadans]